MDSKRPASPYTTAQMGLTASEKVASLFQPDTLLSAQYFDDRRRKTILEPEKRLMLAILEDAVACFREHHLARHGKRKQLFDDVRKWILETHGDWVFGFENICSVLGFNSEYIRQGLERWRQRELTKRCSAPLWGETKAPSLRKVAAAADLLH